MRTNVCFYFQRKIQQAVDDGEGGSQLKQEHYLQVSN